MTSPETTLSLPIPQKLFNWLMGQVSETKSLSDVIVEYLEERT